MTVHFEIEAGIATITIDRSRVCNAIDQETAHTLSVSLGAADADDQVRVILLTGAGGHFCVGVDMEAALRGELTRSPVNGFAGVTQRVLKTPMIAAVEGSALAEGFEMALACDMIVAAEDACFGLCQTSEGLIPDAGGLTRLPRQLPPKIAAELIMTARTVSAAFLASHGLINRVVSPGTALSVARALGRQITANDARTIEVSKRVLNESCDWPASEMFARQDALTASLHATVSGEAVEAGAVSAGGPGS